MNFKQVFSSLSFWSNTSGLEFPIAVAGLSSHPSRRERRLGRVVEWSPGRVVEFPAIKARRPFVLPPAGDEMKRPAGDNCTFLYNFGRTNLTHRFPRERFGMFEMASNSGKSM
jgi:hypothetical protein